MLDYTQYFDGYLFGKSDPTLVQLDRLNQLYQGIIPIYSKLRLVINMGEAGRAWRYYYSLNDFDFKMDRVNYHYKLRRITKLTPYPEPRVEDLDMREYIHEAELPYRLANHIRDIALQYHKNYFLREKQEVIGTQRNFDNLTGVDAT